MLYETFEENNEKLVIKNDMHSTKIKKNKMLKLKNISVQNKKCLVLKISLKFKKSNKQKKVIINKSLFDQELKTSNIIKSTPKKQSIVKYASNIIETWRSKNNYDTISSSEFSVSLSNESFSFSGNYFH